MGCCSSRQIDDTAGHNGPTEPKPVTNATSPETKISTASGDVPTGPDMAQLKSSGGAPGWADTVAAPRPTRLSTHKAGPQTVVGGDNPPKISGQPAILPLSAADYHQKIISATHPDIRFPLEIDELQGLSSASGKLSERVKALDRTGQLTERTKPKFTGSFSEVSQAKLGDLVVAVKTLRVANTEGDEDRIWKRLAREIYVWAGLDHPNVLVLLGFAIDYGKPCLISPWCDNGTLQEYLHKFPDADRRRLVRDIADGLRYLHLQTPPIIHGDLKMTNIFVTTDHVAKISDFGGSKRAEQLRTGFTTDGLVLATTRFTSPEILRDGQKPSLSSDVFSFACVTLETMTGKCPFWKITNVVGVITQVVSKKQTPSQEDHPGMEEASWELLRRCWNYEPSDRPHMVDVCNMLSAAGYGPFTRLYPPTPTGPSTATFVQT